MERVEQKLARRSKVCRRQAGGLPHSPGESGSGSLPAVIGERPNLGARCPEVVARIEEY